MSGKLFRAVIAAVLLAFVLSVSAPPHAVDSVVLAVECEATASGCH